MIINKLTATIAGLSLGVALSVSAATAKELSLAVFIPAASPTIQKVYMPWIEWFNEKSKSDDVSIKLFAGGTLGRNPRTQADLVANGVADMTLTVPSYTPGVYPDYDIFELPGFATNVKEGSYAVKELYEEGKLKGYENFHVVAVYTSGAYMLHSKPEISSFSDIKDKKFRVAGKIQAATIDALKGVPQSMSALEMAENIDRGLIDGAVADASVAKTFKVSEVAKNHFEANLGVLIFTIVMNKDVYEALPEGVKKTLAESRQYVIDRQIDSYSKAIKANLKAWGEDSAHKVVSPSESDQQKIAEATSTVVELVRKNSSAGLIEAYSAKLKDIRSR